LASHSRTAEQFATTAFSGRTASDEPKQNAPPLVLGIKAYSNASRRNTVGALHPQANADTPQATLST
jgi:hypothetical protein